MAHDWTPEERKAVGERLKAARDAKEKGGEPAPPEAGPQPDPDPETLPQPEPTVQELQAQIAELKALITQNPQLLPATPPLQPGAQATSQGMVGTLEKFLVDPEFYPDPRPRLTKEPRLSRFAFDINYELAWDIAVTQYETIDRIRIKEPRFTLELNRVMMDEETGEPTPGRYTIRTMMFHEDPQAAIILAHEQDFPLEQLGEKEFLDEMRYLRMKRWLLEAFYPSKPNSPKKNKKEMVIGGKLVQYFEVSAPDSQSIPFDKLDNKL